jgi:hypothetical protein
MTLNYRTEDSAVASGGDKYSGESLACSKSIHEKPKDQKVLSSKTGLKDHKMIA